VFLSNGRPVVYRRTAFSVTTVPVGLGRQNEKFIEVRSALSVDDRVMTPKSAEKAGPKS
jgi:hypothetical protein